MTYCIVRAPSILQLEMEMSRVQEEWEVAGGPFYNRTSGEICQAIYRKEMKGKGT